LQKKVSGEAFSAEVFRLSELQLGFLLTRHWRDTAAGTEVEFWLATDDGPRHIRLRPQPNVAFLPAAHRERAEDLLHREKNASSRGVELRPLDLCDFQHRPVLGLYCPQYRQLTGLDKRLKQGGVDVYEADVFPPERYMMERFITAPVQFGGDANPAGHGPLLNADMKPASGYRPKLKLVSLDIETSAHAELYSIALEGCGQRQVYMLGPPNGDAADIDFALEYCDTRAQLIERLIGWLETHDPDAIIGWNVVQFDLKVLHETAQKCGVPLRIGRGGAVMEWREHGLTQNHFFAGAPGRLIIDGIEAPRGAFRRSASNMSRSRCWAKASRSTTPISGWTKSSAASTRTSPRSPATTWKTANSSRAFSTRRNCCASCSNARRSRGCLPTAAADRWRRSRICICRACTGSATSRRISATWRARPAPAAS
jgi:DNA polymerase-2